MNKQVIGVSFSIIFLSLIDQVNDYQIMWEEDRDSCLKMTLVKVVEISQKEYVFLFVFLIK